MAEFNETTNAREISPGPRGHSVNGVEVSDDGTTMYLTTTEPRTLNGIRLPAGPQGEPGLEGLPGESRIRVDTTAGHRVFQWDAGLMAEVMLYGDTGRRLLEDGTTWVRRTEANTVETNALDTTTLPAGFRPVSPEATGAVFTTADDWPSALPGTELTAPKVLRGLEGYDAARTHGYPGTAEEFLHMVYRVVLPPAGAPGQVLTRTAAGSSWLNPPSYGPGPWVNVTLNANWKPSTGQSAQVRLNSGTVELIGEITYVGPKTNAGIWGVDFVPIGTVPPAYAPGAFYEVPVHSFRGVAGEGNTRVIMVLKIDLLGQLALGAFSYNGETSIPVLADHTKVNLGAIPSYALRNSSPVA